MLEIKELRLNLGLTQEEFAHQLGVTWKTVSLWERGICKPSKLAQIQIKNLQKRTQTP